jgi:hypothetical protein
MKSEKLAKDFALHALAKPAIPLDQVLDALTHGPGLRARAQVDLLIASDAEARRAAAGVDELVEMTAAEMVVRPDIGGDLTLVAESIANAVRPLARAVLVRDMAPTHPEIQPLLALADRLVPPV